MGDSERDAVLAVNLEFYHAFTTQDVPAMERLWAHRTPITCIHPGWRALSGREEVMNSWYNILTSPDAPHIMCHDDDAFLYGPVAIVLCEEEVRGRHLAATNIFVQEDGQWRMVHHQAGPLIARGRPGRPPPVH